MMYLSISVHAHMRMHTKIHVFVTLVIKDSETINLRVDWEMGKTGSRAVTYSHFNKSHIL